MREASGIQDTLHATINTKCGLGRGRVGWVCEVGAHGIIVASSFFFSFF